MKKIIFLLAVPLILLSGCALSTKPDLAAFYAHQPRSIVVVPVANDSPEITAPAVFTPSLTMPLAERGYYVFPIYLTEMLLRDLGLSEAGHIHQMPPQRFLELFGADAVLLITIKDWSTKYIVISSSIVVAADYVLKDTRTGMILWRGNRSIIKQPNSGGGGLIGMLVSSVVHALITDYRPLAREANNTAFLPPHGLPAGPYHPEFGKDKNRFE